MLALSATRRKPGFRVKPPSGGRGPAPIEAVFTIDDLVAYLKLPKSTVYKLAQDGKIPGLKVGRHWRFLKTTIDEWLHGSAKAMTGGSR